MWSLSTLSLRPSASSSRYRTSRPLDRSARSWSNTIRRIKKTQSPSRLVKGSFYCAYSFVSPPCNQSLDFDALRAYSWSVDEILEARRYLADVLAAKKVRAANSPLFQRLSFIDRRRDMMTPQELHNFKIDLLDELHELATEPVADPEPIKQRIEAFFQRLEAEHGEKTE
jgi:hypothetical protein